MPYFIVDSDKSVEQAATDLEAAVTSHKFGTLHIHNISGILQSKGFDFNNECRVFEVCNPGQAVKVLEHDMKMNMALPCRISVYSEEGQTKIGMISPKLVLSMLSKAPELTKIAEEVDTTMQDIINAAK